MIEGRPFARPAVHATRLRNPKRRGEEDRVLPLINVVFLLLIFFMLAGRFAASEPFSIEPARSASEGQASQAPAVLLLHADGRLALDGVPVGKSALQAEVAARLREEPALTLQLKADGRSSANDVLAVLEILREAGARELRLLTSPVPPMSPLRARHCAAALAAALALHLGAAIALLRPAPERGAIAAGAGGIEVGLGPAGGMPGGAAPDAETATERSAGAVAEPARAPVEPRSAPPPTTGGRVARPSPETLSPKAPSPGPLVQMPAPPPEAADIPLPHMPPARAGRSDPEIPVPPPVRGEPPMRQAVLPPVPASKPPPAESQLASRPAEPPDGYAPRPPPEPLREEPAAAPAAQAVGAAKSGRTPAPPGVEAFSGVGGKAGAGTTPAAGAAEAVSGGGRIGAPADYLARLQAWLERHKAYPRRARLRRQEGTAHLYFVMDAAGRVLECRIAKSSGHGTLDREVASMIRRAEPLPRPPLTMPQSRLELVIPVQFLLR